MNLRQTEILEIARTEGRVSVDRLAARFGVTLQTVRRDLADLSAAGKLERVHGGAVLPSGVANIEYEERRRLNAEAKERIARAVADRLPDGSSIFLNIGTTTEAVARALRDHTALMVVTNNLHVGQILQGHPGCEVVITGGQLRPEDGGLVGDMAAGAVRLFKLDYAVIGASALDVQGDFLDFDLPEVRVTQAILEQARSRVLVADGSKFERVAPVRVGTLATVDLFVTDVLPPDPVSAACEGWGTEILAV